MTTLVSARIGRENNDVSWDDFDPDLYFANNYGILRTDDRQIIDIMGEFFARTARRRNGESGLGVDIGTGTNLYPAMAMLPFCRTIVMRERGTPNCLWLRDQLRGRSGYSASWDPFWAALSADRPAYAAIGHPRASLSARARINRGSVFNVQSHAYDIGTMFFVAESISDRYSEFADATRRFVRSLKPGAPFAAAFMRESKGYRVGSRSFPAVAITEEHVEDCLGTEATGVTVERIDSVGLREGYEGMMLATGKAGRSKR